MEDDRIGGSVEVTPVESATEASPPDEVDPAALRRMKFVARVLDESVRVPGTNFKIGLDPLLGLIPGGGDLLSAGISAYIVVEAARQGAAKTTLVRMLVNLLLDTVVGSIPVVGDLFDAVWKANSRNLDLALAELESA